MVKVFIHHANRRSMTLSHARACSDRRVALSTYLLVRRRQSAREPPAAGLESLLIAFVCQLCLYYADVKRLRHHGGPARTAGARPQALGGSSMILADCISGFPGLVIGHGVVSLAAVLAVALVIAWRVAFYWLARSFAPRKRFLIIGTSPTALNFARRELHAATISRGHRRLRRSGEVGIGHG